MNGKTALFTWRTGEGGMALKYRKFKETLYFNGR